MLPDAEVAVRAALAGSATAQASFGTPLDRHEKGGTDFATEADVATERAIRAVIAAARPADAVTGEELGESGPAGVRRWLVDPICGTLNYAAGIPLYAVNVALEVDGVAQVAAVADPAGRVLWTDGRLAHMRTDAGDEPLRPSAVSRLMTVNLESDYPGRSGVRLLDDPRIRSTWSPRVVSTTLAVAWVACGQSAAYVTGGQLHGSVHFAAGIALCRAAGAVVTALDGGPLGPTAEGLLAASDAETHTALLARLEELAAR